MRPWSSARAGGPGVVGEGRVSKVTRPRALSPTNGLAAAVSFSGLVALACDGVTSPVRPNRPPEATGRIPELKVEWDSTAVVDVASYFSDPDGDPLHYTAVSSDLTSVVVEVAGSAVAVTGLAPASATVTVTATDPAGLSVGQDVAVTVPAWPSWWRERRPGVVLGGGTVWQETGVITESDPTALDSIVDAGRGLRGFFDPFPDERRWRNDLDVFLFTAHFGTHTMEIQAHPAYLTRDSARVAAEMFVPPMGRLPRVLIVRGREIELTPTPEGGAGGNRCGGIYHWQGPGFGGFVEEVALHEGSHATLEQCDWPRENTVSGINGDPAWQAAQAADSLFISQYARDNPYREDVAETLLWWFVSRCVPDRVHPAYKYHVDAGIPQRLAYLDSLDLDMSPYNCASGTSIQTLGEPREARQTMAATSRAGVGIP